MNVGVGELRRTAGIAALVVFGLLLLSGRSGDLLPSQARLGLLLALPIVGLLFWWRAEPTLVVVYLVFGGLLLRLVDFPPGGAGGSDVLAAVNEGIGVMLGGGNPYDHVYQATRPAGQPLPYPPGALLIHLPGHLWSGLYGVQMTEVVLGAAAMLLLALLGWVAGSLALATPAVALYAGLGNLVNLSIDGSNDTGTGALLLAALVALAWALRRGARPMELAAAGLLAGVALLTKQSALPLALLPAAYLWSARGRAKATPYLGGLVAVISIVSLPFLAMGPVAFVGRLASFSGVHADLYGWNVWTFAHSAGWPVADVATAGTLTLLVGVIALLIALAVPYRQLAAAVLAGIAVTLAALFAARWTTYAYFAMLAPIVLAVPMLLASDREQATLPGSAVAA